LRQTGQELDCSTSLGNMLGRLKSVLSLGKKRHADSESNQVPTRITSYPFLSGDTFRQMSETGWEEGQRSFTRSFGAGVVFVDADTACSPEWNSRLSASLETSANKPHTLIIHNGDTVPSPDQLRQLRGVFERVFCVNVLDGIDGVYPIPIGLENAWHNKNGRLRYYLDQPEHSGVTGQQSRFVLSSFSVGTNRLAREPVAEAMKASRHGFQGMVWKSGEFRQEIRQSLFVVAPPGNGLDTHRTWEAIYLGAVPVVWKDSLANSLISKLPVLVVDHIDEFLALSDDELVERYHQIRKIPADVAYAPHWLTRINGGGLLDDRG